MAQPLIDRDKLTDLWSKELTVPQIAKLTGWKPDTIYKCAHRWDLPKRKSGAAPILTDPEKRKWFIRNYPEMSNGTIGVYLGMSRDYVGKLARQLGLKKSEEYMECVKKYHKKRMKEVHAAHKGDKDYYAYNAKPRDNKGKFKKTNDNENLYKFANIK